MKDLKSGMIKYIGLTVLLMICTQVNGLQPPIQQSDEEFRKRACEEYYERMVERNTAIHNIWTDLNSGYWVLHCHICGSYVGLNKKREKYNVCEYCAKVAVREMKKEKVDKMSVEEFKRRMVKA